MPYTPRVGEHADVTADAEDSPARERDGKRETVKTRHEIKMNINKDSERARSFLVSLASLYLT